MINRYTQSALESLGIANGVAVHSGASTTQLVHALACTARDPHYVAARALAMFDVEYPVFRPLLGIDASECHEAHPPMSFSKPLGKALEGAMMEAILSGHQDICTGHIAAAILAKPDPAVLALLDAVHLDPEGLRGAIYAVLAEDPGAIARESPHPFATGAERAEWDKLSAIMRRQHMGFWKGYMLRQRNEVRSRGKDLGF